MSDRLCVIMPVYNEEAAIGEGSLKKGKLLKAAMRSFRQTVAFALASARGKDWLRLVFWGLAWAFVALSLAIGFKNGLREFDFQWDPAKLLMMGDNPYLYSLEHKAIPYEGFMRPFVDANQVPSCLLLLLPFTFLPQLLANQVWDVCNLVFTVVFLVYLYRSFFKDKPVADKFVWVALVFLSSTPLRTLIGCGQHLMFSLAFFMPAYYYATKERWQVSGVLLALSAFKYTTIAPLAFIFVFRRWWRPLVTAAVLHVVATIGCGLYLHESPLTLVLQSLQVGAGLTGTGICDIASLIHELGFEHVTSWAIGGYVLWGILLLGLTFAKKRDDLLTLSLLSVLSNVMFYHRDYDLVTLIFPFAYLVSNAGRTSPSFKLLKWISIAEIAWRFYGSRIALGLDMNFLPPDFVLMPILLLSLVFFYIRSESVTPIGLVDRRNA